jgi:hypothetical protein
MKIGIYGDSYTTPHGKFDAPTNWYNHLASLLSDTHNSTTINHYGRAGSSLYYSYRKFLDTNHENDLNIILVTGPGRYPHVVELSVPGNSRTFTCKEDVQHYLNTQQQMLSKDDVVMLNDIIGWFNASIDYKYFQDMSELMVSKLDSVKNTILYPCFSDSLNKEQLKKLDLDKDIHYMHSFWFRQLEIFGIEPNTFTAIETKNLCGHLTEEFNIFFANMVYKKIQTGKWDHSGFLDVTIKKPRKFYYDNFKHE